MDVFNKKDFAMKILILNANPREESFSDALAASYSKGAADSGHEVKFFNLRDLKFDPILHGGYHKPTELEDSLKDQQEAIKWCEHLVIITPMWWSGAPALLKGYIDRVLLPGFAFKFKEGGTWDRLLAGKSARVIYTQDSPLVYSFLVIGDAFWNALKKGILEFSGFKPVKRTVFSRVSMVKPEKRQEWIDNLYLLGKKGA